MKKLFFLLMTLLPIVVWADVEITETNFPDENFRNWLLSQEYGTDGVLTDEEIAGIQSIDVSGLDIQSLKGIEFFMALTQLKSKQNQLTTLNVSQNAALEYLDCSNTGLTSLDVSKNTALTNLYCYDNQLTALDVSKNTALTKLDCAYNLLTTLDLSQNTALTMLYCNYNKLTTLDVSKNTALGLLVCFGNQIKGMGMDALVVSMPTISNGELYVIYNEDEKNEMTTTQVAAAKDKGWTPYYYDGGNWKEYAGSEPEGIDNLTADSSKDNAVYNLSGQRTKGLTKGINIVDGKKVMVK